MTHIEWSILFIILLTSGEKQMERSHGLKGSRALREKTHRILHVVGNFQLPLELPLMSLLQ